MDTRGTAQNDAPWTGLIPVDDTALWTTDSGSPGTTDAQRETGHRARPGTTRATGPLSGT